MDGRRCERCGELAPPHATICSRCLVAHLDHEGPVPIQTLDADDPVGERLRERTEGRFRILGRLGRGGMASVYAARDLSLGRTVAIKVLAGHLFERDDLQLRFEKEARTVAALDHPGIVKIHSVEHHPDLHYLILQYVPGRSLDRVLSSGSRLSVDLVAEWFEQLADALEYSHRRGVVHRDVKPGNILIRDSGEAVLTDFGIAKVLAATNLTRTRFLVGTAEYMSPERFSGDEVTAAADQYSLGIVLYEALTGENPFRREGNDAAVLRNQLELVPPRLADRHGDVPRPLSDAVARMLAKDPGERFPTVLEAARAAQGAAPVFAHPKPASPAEGVLSPPPHAGTPGRGRLRTPRTLAVVALATLLAVAGASLAARNFGPPEDETGGAAEPLAAATQGGPEGDGRASDDLGADNAGGGDADADRAGLDGPPSDGGEDARPTSSELAGTEVERPDDANVAAAPRRRTVAASGGLALVGGLRLEVGATLDIQPARAALWCGVVEWRTAGGESLFSDPMPVPVSASGEARVAAGIALDALRDTENGTALPALETTAGIRLWEAECSAGSTSGPADHDREIGEICAQLYPSGTWRVCR